MSDSEDYSDIEDSTLYRDKAEWKDVTPISQPEAGTPVVQIAYTERFRDAFDYFRAVLKSNEVSERALALTLDASQLNPANYTVWRYRRMLLKELNKDLRAELKYIGHVIEDSPKNYQVWHHRQMLVDWLRDPTAELKFTASILREDAKNYHAWQFRQWVLTEFNLFDNELDYTSQLLDDDVRNNSAWNQRHFVISRTTDFTSEVVDREVEFTKSKILLVPNNESAWNYLRGILMDSGLSSRKDLRPFCEALVETSRNPLLLGFYIDLIKDEIESGTSANPTNDQKTAMKMCESLATTEDPVRREFWNYIKFGLEKLIIPVTS